jgi:4-hydroxy-tetrahydrodipicolinate synthase
LDTLLRICQPAGIVGIKESSGSAEFTRKLLETDLGIPVFEGGENLLYEVRGIVGFIGPLANVEPQLCMRMLEHPPTELQNRINAACTRYGLVIDVGTGVTQGHDRNQSSDVGSRCIKR